MPTRTGKALALLALVALPAVAGALDPVEYYATVDRDECSVDDVVNLSVTLAMNENKEPAKLELPKAPDFDVLSQSRSDQMSFAFGGGTPSYRKVRVYSLVLRPKREGELAILPGFVVLDGKRYETARLTVKVGPPGSLPSTRAPPAPQPPAASPFGAPPPGLFDDDEDPFGAILGGGPQPGDSDVFLRSVVDRRSAYVGEQVTLSVYLMSRLEISGIEAFKMPKLDGFWAEDIASPTQITGELKYVDGVPYRAYLLKRRALFPLKAGAVTIDPVEVDVVTGFSFLASGRKVHRKSVAASLEVKPLPAGAPPGFGAGNVGKWQLTGSAEPGEVPVGSPLTVRVTVSGRGNLRNVEAPPLPPIAGFKIFDPTRDEKVQIKGGSYGGRKTLEYVLVPEQAGTFTIPGLSLSYFDPKQDEYLTSELPARTVTVTPGGAGAGVARVTPDAVDGSSGLRPLHAADELHGPGRPLYERPWFGALLLVPGLLVVGATVWPRLQAVRARGEGGRRLRGAGKVARKRLAAATKHAVARDRRFFAELDRALHEYLAVKLGRPTVGLTRDDLATALVAAGAGAASATTLTELLDRCDVGRFAPGTVDAAGVDLALEQGLSLIDELEATRLTGARA